MAGRFRWQTPPPTSVDERLTVSDDGTADLLLLSPRRPAAEIGWYRWTVRGSEAALLAAAGEVVVDVRQPPPADLADVVAAAERVAAAAHEAPVAAVRFVAAMTTGPVLAAVASGTEPLAFELDVPGSAVIFEDETGQALGWQPLPDLASGFMSPDADGLGGVRRAAEIPPGAFGAIALPLAVLEGAVAIRMEVVGWLSSAPHEPTPVPFRVRTEASPVPRPTTT